LTAAILVGGPLTGGSLNPARTLGTAVYTAPSLANVYTYVTYLFGPLIGSTAALLAYNFFTGAEGKDAPAPAKAAGKTVSRKPAAKAKK
jgi:glycerol uptake facilitator-like aquaporin